MGGNVVDGRAHWTSVGFEGGVSMTTGSEQSGGWWPAEDDAATSWLPEREPPPLSPGTDGPPTTNARPVRLALGLAILAAERLRATGRPTSTR